MFTQTHRAGWGTRLLGLLAGPHGVDRYTELLDPMWTSEVRATVVRLRHTTPGSITLWLAPNHPVAFRAGQYLTVTVEIDGRRHTRCYSPPGTPPTASSWRCCPTSGCATGTPADPVVIWRAISTRVT